MRTATLVLALAFVCAASPALAQARILAAPEQAQDQAPAPQAPAKDENQAPAETPAQPPTKTQDQIPSEAQRQDRGRPLVPGRYSFNRVDDGLLRLDRHSGEVAFCRPNTTGWVCEAVPENRAVLEKEIAQLRDEVAALQKEIASLRTPPPPPVPPQTVPPAPHPGKDGDAQIKLPTAEDVARARAFIADTWHRLVEMIENWQKDVLRKS
jgi:hypothetical protein